MAVKIAIVNKKGGVGKTTSAINIADVLRSKKKKVLMIDLDPQHNVTMTYDAKYEGEKTIFDVLNGDFTVMDAVQHKDLGDIVPGDKILTTQEMQFMSRTGREMLLKEGMEEADNFYDFILMDTPPTPGVYTLNALTAADGCVIPIKCDDYSIAGLSEILEVIEDVKKHVNKTLRIYGVFIVAMDKRENFHRQVYDTLPEACKKIGLHAFKTPIRVCAEIAKTRASKLSLLENAPKSNGAADYQALTKELLKEVKRGV